jgi:multidrug resistance efflux pump
LVGNFTSPDRVQRAQTDAESSSALVREAEAAVERARNKLGEFDGRNTRVEQATAALRDFELKVSYCKIYAPCDGYVTNLQIAPGTYASAGEQIFSLVDSSVWFVLANFRETDLRRIRPGQSARVYLMAQRGKVVIEGWKESVRRGEFRPVVRELLTDHYDPVYLQSMERNFTQFGNAAVLSPTDRSLESMQRVAQALVAAKVA